jgi:maltooligosyltrehalose trehalohydrolase
MEAGGKAGAAEQTVPLKPEPDGYFSGLVTSAGAGMLYRYRLEDEANVYSVPASHFRPHDPHGASQIIDLYAFHWTIRTWPGVRLGGQVIYEMHLGTLTQEGTWEAAGRELPELTAAGMTVIEIMPTDFIGRYGWGHDGVDLFAPSHLYGTPDDCRRFVNRAHTLGLGVILDVIYNHLGPDGNFVAKFSPDSFTERYSTNWGPAINFGGEPCGPMCEFFLANAGYWIDEFHFDGLRLDPTQEIYDQASVHILAAIAQAVVQNFLASFPALPVPTCSHACQSRATLAPSSAQNLISPSTSSMLRRILCIVTC